MTRLQGWAQKESLIQDVSRETDLRVPAIGQWLHHWRILEGHSVPGTCDVVADDCGDCSYEFCE